MNRSGDAELIGRARRVLPGGITRSTVFVPPHPPYAARGSGPLVHDESGNTVIDCNNNYTSLIHGHAHPVITEAVSKVIPEGSAFGLPTRSEVALADRLAQRTGQARWRFCNSGTEAVLMLIRAARAHTGRDLIVRFEGSYHGTGDEVVGSHALGVPRRIEDSVLVLPQGDRRALTDAFDSHGRQIAAVLIDLIPNRAGLHPADPDFVHELRELTTRHGALLAVDEVISFRLRPGGFHHAYEIEPDLISLGKVIGGGFPAGAVGGSAEVLSSFDPGVNGAVMWGGTFSANPVTMTAGLAALDLYDAVEVDQLNARGDRLRETLMDDGVLVRGSGSLLRIATNHPAELWWRLYERGVLAGTNGLIALSTAMTSEHVDHIRHAVRETWDELGTPDAAEVVTR